MGRLKWACKFQVSAKILHLFNRLDTFYKKTPQSCLFISDLQRILVRFENTQKLVPLNDGKLPLLVKTSSRDGFKRNSHRLEKHRCLDVSNG